MKRRYPELDGVRGLLSLVVMLFHYGLTPLVSRMTRGAVPSGRYELAVDFFFILSGFVLGSAYLDKKPGLWSFFSGRCLRILPVSLVALALCLPVSDFPLDAPTLVSNSLLLQGFFDKPHLNHVSWSACCELWLPPALIFSMLLLTSLRRNALFGLLVVLWVVGGTYLSGVIFRDDITVRDNFSDSIRAFVGLLNGFLLCVLASSGAWPWLSSNGPVRPFILLLFSTATFVLGAKFPVMVLLFPAAAACCIISLRGSDSFLSGKVLQFFGARSYAIYMLHWPVLLMSDRWLGPDMLKGNVLLKLSLMAATVFLADVVHRFIELPCMRLRRPARIS